MFNPNDYFSQLLKNMSDLESTEAKNSEAEAMLRELEAKVADLEENEKQWQGERRLLLRRIKDDKDG